MSGNQLKLSMWTLWVQNRTTRGMDTFNMNMNQKATGGGVNASQTVSLNRKCQDLILKSACLPTVRETVLVPILDYLANDAQPKITLKDDPIKVMWSLFRQGSYMCELLNQVQPGVIQSVALPIPPMGSTNFSDTNSRQNVAAFIKASRDMFFLTDDQLFNPGEMYKEDFNAFSKALGLCEMYLNNKIRVSTRSSFSVADQKFDEEISYLFDVSGSEKKPEESTKAAVKVPKRTHILEEMIASERVYVDDLARLNKYKEMIKFERLLSAKTIDLIFSNLKDLLNFQRKFMIEMENQIQKDHPDFAKLFKDHEADFSLYEEFCLNHSVSLATIKENKKILDSRPDLLEGVGDVQGYMIKPIQRVTRYSLFLRDLIKEAQKQGDTEEAKNAEEAAESVKRVANRINERQRADENEKASALFFSHFNPKFISPDKTGKLVLYDTSMKVKLDGEQKVYQVFLFQKKLIMCAETEVFGPFWLKNRISLNTIKDVKATASNNIQVPFEAVVICSISDKNVAFSLLFRTEQAQRMWINSLRSLAELPALEFATADEVAVVKVPEAAAVDNEPVAVEEEPKVSTAAKDTIIRILFREEYFSFVIAGASANLCLLDLSEMVRNEIVKSYQLEYQKVTTIPPIDRLRLRYLDPSDGKVIRLSNDQLVGKLLTSGDLVDLIVYEGVPIRVRFTYRDCMYSFMIDDLSAIEELKIYIYETISEDYKMISADIGGIPKGDAMRLFFKESDGNWSLMLYDNDLEVALKESNRRLDLKL